MPRPGGRPGALCAFVCVCVPTGVPNFVPVLVPTFLLFARLESDDLTGDGGFDDNSLRRGRARCRAGASNGRPIASHARASPPPLPPDSFRGIFEPKAGRS